MSFLVRRGRVAICHRLHAPAAPGSRKTKPSQMQLTIHLWMEQDGNRECMPSLPQRLRIGTPAWTDGTVCDHAAQANGTDPGSRRRGDRRAFMGCPTPEAINEGSVAVQ